MSLDKLRELPEFKGASDAEIISTLAKTTQQPLADVASAFGMDVGGKWGNRLSASVDSYQAGLLGLGETVFGSKTLGDMRRRNEADAELSRSIAQKQGAIMSYKDIGGVGDFFDYAGGLAVQMVPYAAESLAGGLVARGLSTGLRGVAAAGRAADATTDAVRAGMAAEKALATRATLGGVAASYPSSVGDILQNQRDEAGTTDLGAAALGGIPYAALNAFGLEGALAKGKLARSGIQALDNVGGLRGGLLRTGASALKSAAPEGLSETGQELINQSFGRMAVNPDQTLFNPEANERYLESFVGGATLGGVFGGAAGGWRRSEGYLPPGQKLDDPSAPANLLGSQGELFNDLGDEGKVSWLPQEPQDQDGALVARYQELRTAASQLESGMAAAEAAKDRDRFYQLQEQHLAVLREMEPLERTYSAIVAERQSPGQMGLFGSGERDSGRPAFALSGYGPEEGPLYGTIDATGAEPLSPQPGQMNLLSGVFQTVGGQPVELTSDELRAGGLYENRQNNLFTDPNPLQQRIDQNLGIGTRNTPRNYPSQFQAAASEPTNLFAVNPENNLETQLDVGQVSALQAGDTSQLTPIQARAKAVGAAAAQEKQTIEGRRERAAMVGLDPKNTKHVQAWGYIEDALDNGTIDQDEAARLAANVSAGIDKVGGIQKYLVAKAQQQEITAQANATETQTLIDNLKTKTNGTQTAQAVQGQTQESETLPAGTAVRGANVQASATPGTPAASTRGGLPAEGRSSSMETTGLENKPAERLKKLKELRPSDSNRPKDPTAAAIYDDRMAAFNAAIPNKAAIEEALLHILTTTDNPQILDRIKKVTGYDTTLDEQGKHRLIQVNNPAPIVQVAENELGANPDPKKVRSLEASISKQLIKHTGLYQEVIDRLVTVDAPTSVSAAELGLDEDGKLDAYQTGDTISEVTGTGLSSQLPQHIKARVSKEMSEIKKAGFSDESIKAARDRLNGIKFRANEDAVVDTAENGEPVEQDSNVGSFVKTNPYVQALNEALADAELKKRRTRGRVSLGDAELTEDELHQRRLNALRESHNAVQAAKRTPIYHAAESQWNDNRSDDTPEFSNLPIARQEAWLKQVDQIIKDAQRGIIEKANIDEELYNAQRDFERAAPDFQSELERDRATAARAFGQDGQKSSGVGRAGPAVSGAATQVAPVDAPTSAKSKLKAAGQNIAKANLNDAELAWAVETYERLGNEEKAKEARSEQQRRVSLQNDSITPDSSGIGTVSGESSSLQRSGERGGGTFNTGTESTAKTGTSSSSGTSTSGSRDENPGTEREVQQAGANSDAKSVTPFTGVISSNEQEASSKSAQSAAQPQNASVAESSRQPGPGQQKESVAGRSGQADRGVTTAEVVANLKEFLRKDALGRKVIVVQSVSDLPKGVRVSSKSKTQGMAIDDGPYGRVAYLIADNLTRDNIRAVFMHEVGSHLALDNMLNTQAMANLVEQIKNWAKLGVGGSTKQEHVLAAAAARRVQKSVKNPEHYRSELLAYFIEEAMGAGVTPTAIQTDKRSPLMAFLRKALALFKDIAAELGVSAKDITAQDIVDLAYGAAQLEMADTGPVASGESLTRENAKFSKAAQTAEGFGRKVAGETGARVAVDASNLAGKVLGSLTYLHDIVESAKSKLPSAEKWHKATMDIQASRNRMVQDADRIVLMLNDSAVNEDKVNKMLFDATFDQKWPYDTQRMNRTTGEMETVKADPALAARFKAELNDKERAVVKAVFDHGERALARKYEILKKLGLNGVFKNETGKLQGPYAPLKRFGNYISVLKSADLVAAEKANDEGLVEKLKSDPKHYEVRFHDTKGLANEYALANAKDWAESYHFEKSERVGQAMPMSASVLRNIRAALEMEGDLPPESIRHFEEMLQNLEFQALDEHHARTSGLTRKNRAGAEADMMRSFLANARAQSNFLAQLEFGKEANQQFYAMQKEAQRNRHAGQDDFNLIAKHYAASFDNRDTLLSRIDSRVTGFTTMMQLATSVGYHITNMLQGVMVTVPKLAGDFGNYTGAMDSLMTGYKTWSQGGGAKGRFDINSVKDAGLRAVLQRAADMGVLDVGMTEDLSQFESFRTGYKGIDAASSGLSKMMHKLNQVARYVETANRVSAATAAYKMAMEKYKDQAKAQEYAVRVLQTTQGEFSMSGAPLIFKKMPRFVMQYKKYPFMMASLYANAFKQALRGATPEERAIGRRFLAYKLATSSVAAGALGLPLINVAALVFGMTGDDDEPRDLERSLRNMIGDDDLADIILRGPLNAIGLDMSAKLGDDKIFSISPYTDIDFSTGANAAKTIVGIAGGPAASQVMRMANGVEYLSRGEMQKGFENLVPSGLANASKAYRIANEGYTLKNGTIMFAPDEISGLTLWADAIGLKSSQMKHMEYVRGQQYEIGQFFSDRTKDLKASYVQAYRDGDTKEMGELADHWMKLQQAKRELRQMFNNSSEELKTQPLSSLLKAPANAVKRDMKAQKASW